MSERVKFASQVDAELLGKVRHLAVSEGRQLQALIEEALADLIEKRAQSRPQADAMAVYRSTVARFGSVYERLAK